MKYTYWHFTHEDTREDFPELSKKRWFETAFFQPIWTAILIEEVKDCHKIDKYMKENITPLFYEWGSKVYIFCSKLTEKDIDELLKSFEQIDTI